jgi:hypothetical protein
MHPLMPDQSLVIRCRLLDVEPPRTLDKPLAIRAGVETELNEILPLNAAGAAIRVARYLPHGILEQNVVPTADDSAPPAVQLLIQGSTQSFSRWLIAGDPERNRLSSFIATWRYMSVANENERDELFTAFETELTRPPKLFIHPAAKPNEVVEIPAVGSWQAIGESGLRVRTKQFLPDARMQGAGAEPVNQSERRKNPAVQIELEHKGVTESRWVFAKFPDFGPKRENRLPFEIALDCPIEGAPGLPDFALVTIAGKHEAWTRLNGNTISRQVSIDEATEIPGSQYKFLVKNFVPAAHMVETYKADPKDKAEPAVEVEYSDKAGKNTVWVGLRQYRTVMTTAGAAVLSLDVTAKQASAGHP